MNKVRIGIPVRERADLLLSTLESLRADAHDAEILLLVDGADAVTHAALPQDRVAGILSRDTPQGLPACFNRLLSSGEADVYVLLENGARVGPGWLDRLLAALAADPRHGLAGPSTNLCWNEQCIFPGAGGGSGEIARTAGIAVARYEESVRYLEPLHSLAVFCYAVKREVVDAVGAADEGYGLGPCWEMDYSIRAARAGFRGLWVPGAYVWRSMPTPRQQAEENAWFETAKHRYQDRFCGLRLQGTKHDYDTHCTGEDCPHFAPVGKIQLRIPLTEKDTREPREPASNRPPAPRIQPSDAQPQPPLVSCLMPTRNRRRYVPAAIAAFQRQDYEPRELVIVDDGNEPIADLVPTDPSIRYVREAQHLSVGAKRNLACTLARGDILVHWDDDDWHAPWRVSYQVQELNAHQADLCGLDRLWFYDPVADRAWQYRYAGGRWRWVAGGTLCYRRSLWEHHRFADISNGEDTRFVREASPARVLALQRYDFYVARVHTANTAAKHTGGASWHPCPSHKIGDLLGEDFDTFCEGGPSDVAGNIGAVMPVSHADWPLVSCIMPTFNRRPFVPLALELFFAQDYPHKELVVVDDGSDPVEDLLIGIAGVRYLRMSSRKSIGYKRNLACGEAAGEIIVQWDDDDWYAPARITRQLQPILSNQAEITGIEGNLVMSMPEGEFWRLSPDLHRRMFVGDVHGGTLAFAKSVWSAGAHYPNTSLAEDADFLKSAISNGSKLKRIRNEELFVYTRHEHNAWQFEVGSFTDPVGWERISQPTSMPPDVIASFRAAARRLATFVANKSGALPEEIEPI